MALRQGDFYGGPGEQLSHKLIRGLQMTGKKTQDEKITLLGKKSEALAEDAVKPEDESRRSFFSKMGTTAVAAGALGSTAALLPETAMADFGDYRDIKKRKMMSAKIRWEAAKDEKRRPELYHPNQW